MTRRRTVRWLVVAALLATGGALATPRAVGRYYRERGARAAARFETDAALEWLEQAAAQSPADAQTHFLLGRCYRRQGRLEEMAEALEEAARLGLPSPRIERERRLAIAQTGRVHDVQDDLPAMLASPGEDAAEICAAYVSGYCLSFDFDSAGALLEAWSKDFPNDAEPHFRTGNVWYAQNEWEQAIKSFRRALECDPRHVQARLSLAQCLIRNNEPKEAERHFRQVLVEDSQSVEARIGLGTCLMTLGQLDAARTELERVARQAPEHSEVRRRLAELELSQGRPEEALEWVRPLAESWPDDKVHCTLMAQALQELGRSEEARPYWEGIRRAEESLAHLEKLTVAVQNDPLNVAIRYEIGAMLMRFRSREDGAGWLTSLLQYDPQHAGAHRALAEYYRKSGQNDLAALHEQQGAAQPQVSDER